MPSLQKPAQVLALRKKSNQSAGGQRKRQPMPEKALQAMKEDSLWRIVNEGPLPKAAQGESTGQGQKAPQQCRLLFILRSFLEDWMLKRYTPGSQLPDGDEAILQDFLRGHDVALQLIHPSERH